MSNTGSTTGTYQCRQCGSTQLLMAGARTLYACEDCQAVTTWDRTNDAL